MLKYDSLRGPMGLDESLLDMLDSIINPWEVPVFNPFVALDNKFTIEFTKADGSLGKLTGSLFKPEPKPTKAEVLAICAELSEKDLIPVWTDKGWRSFYASKVEHFKLEK